MSLGPDGNLTGPSRSFFRIRTGTGYYTDNGSEFNNKLVTEFITEKLGKTLQFSPPYSPFSNGENEKNHFAADQVAKKLIEEDPRMSLEDAISKGAWTHNTNANKHGTTPIHLLTGKSATFPGITQRSSKMEVSEYVLQMLRCQETFWRAEFADKIEQAETSTYIPSYHDEFYDAGDWVYVQEHDKKGVWSGPFKVIKQEGNEVVIDKDGEYGTTRLHPCKVARAKFEANENKEEKPKTLVTK